MYYPEELIEEIRMKNDIVEVISGYVRMQRKGGRHWGLCPFHNERTPSFSVSEEKQIYHCFGCGVGGDVFSFITNYENFSFPEAVKMLAERAGVSLPEMEYSQEIRQKENRKARLMEVNKEAAKFFYYQLRNPQGEVGYRYFINRGLTDETLKSFGLGYAPKNGAYLIQYLKQKGFEDKLLLEAGLTNFSEKRGLLSQFWNRVIFPIQDLNNKVIGFGGRVMGEGEPKYLNSPETPVFDKRRNLYGMNFARKARSGNVILCEGYMDTIALHQSGFTQAVASLGTAFTSEQANLIRRYTKDVLLAFDCDGSGVTAALRCIGILREAQIAARVIDMQPYKDPDEFICKMGKEAFQKRVMEAENSFFFEVRILERDYNQSDPELRTRFHREIAKKLCTFQEDIERENYLQAIAEKYFIGADNLRKLVNTYAAGAGHAAPVKRPKTGLNRKTIQEDGVKKAQKLLLAWLSDEPELYRKVKEYISIEDFTEDLLREVARKLFDGLEKGNVSLAGIVGAFADEGEQREAAALFHVSLPESTTKQEKEKAFRDILLKVKQNSYEYYSQRQGEDINAMEQVRNGKKALEALAKAHISLE